MEDVFRMYAMSDGNPDAEPLELTPITKKTLTRTTKSKPPACSPPPMTMREWWKRPSSSSPKCPHPSRPKKAAKKAPQRKLPRKPRPRRRRRRLPRRRQESCGQEGSREKGCGQEGREEVRRKEKRWRKGRKGRSKKAAAKKSASKTTKRGKKLAVKKAAKKAPAKKAAAKKAPAKKAAKKAAAKKAAAEEGCQEEVTRQHEQQGKQKSPASRRAFLRLESASSRFSLPRRPAVDLLQVPALMGDVVLDEEAQRHRRIVADHALASSRLRGCGRPRPSESRAPLPTSRAASPRAGWHSRARRPRHPAHTSGRHIRRRWRRAQSAGGCWRPNPAVADDLLARPAAFAPGHVGELGGTASSARESHPVPRETSAQALSASHSLRAAACKSTAPFQGLASRSVQLTSSLRPARPAPLRSDATDPPWSTPSRSCRADR